MYYQRWACATFYGSSQSQFHDVEKALPQSQFRNFLEKCCSATAIFLKSATLSPPLKSFTTVIFGIFLAIESGRFMKQIEGKSHATVPVRQVSGFQRNGQFY
jgi:hypothetical protein